MNDKVKIALITGVFAAGYGFNTLAQTELFTGLGAVIAQPGNTIPDHVCLPSVSEEDAAWNSLIQERDAASREYVAVDASPKAAFEAEEKVIVMELIKRKNELDAKYDAARELVDRLTPVGSSCGKAELYSQALVSACQELAAAADMQWIASKGKCGDISPYSHGALREKDVKDGSPCAPAARKYWRATGNAYSKYLERLEAAGASYKRKMMPACSLWQRTTFKELDRPTLRARQTCLASVPPPANLTLCTQGILRGPR